MFAMAYQTLGGERGKADTAYQALGIIRDGLPVSFFEQGKDLLGVTRQDYARLVGVRLSQVDRAKKRSLRLSALSSERILMLSNMALQCDAYFGDVQKRNQWLNRSNLLLGNVTPLCICDTAMGISLVNDIITRMKLGFAA